MFLLCENFEKCRNLECSHQYPHKISDYCGMECDMADGKVECLEIVLKKKGGEDGREKLTRNIDS
jgi:hypothetical protein